MLRPTESLAVDERSGQISWTQASFGIVSDIRRANADGSGVQTVVTGVVDDHGIAIDPVGGYLYWAQTTLHNGVIVDHIRRAGTSTAQVRRRSTPPPGCQDPVS